MEQNTAEGRQAPSNTPRCHPRTLQQAFGPYTSTHIEEPGRGRMSRADKAFTWACAIALLAVLAADALGVI